MYYSSGERVLELNQNAMYGRLSRCRVQVCWFEKEITTVKVETTFLGSMYIARRLREMNGSKMEVGGAKL